MSRPKPEDVRRVLKLVYKHPATSYGILFLVACVVAAWAASPWSTLAAVVALVGLLWPLRQSRTTPS